MTRYEYDCWQDFSFVLAGSSSISIRQCKITTSKELYKLGSSSWSMCDELPTPKNAEQRTAVKQNLRRFFHAFSSISRRKKWENPGPGQVLCVSYKKLVYCDSVLDVFSLNCCLGGLFSPLNGLVRAKPIKRRLGGFVLEFSAGKVSENSSESWFFYSFRFLRR